MCSVSPKEGLSSTSSTLCLTANMSLFGSASGFGTGGTSMFGSTTTDNHNPMKVSLRSSKGVQKESGHMSHTAGSWRGREPESLLWGEEKWGGVGGSLAGLGDACGMKLRNSRAQSSSSAELVSCPHFQLATTVQSTCESQSFPGPAENCSRHRPKPEPSHWLLLHNFSVAL